MTHLTRRTALAAAVVLLSSSAAFAQAYPNKPIRAVVPFAPGSATDQIGRAFAEKMQASLGQTIVIDGGQWLSGSDYWGRVNQT